MLLVQGIHVADELLALLEEFFRGGFVFLWRGLTGNVHRALHLTEEVRLRRLVGVHFQTERTCSHLRQSLLHHFECCHLLCHEEHTLAVVERVGNHVRDGLALTRTRRAIEDETLTFARLNHSFQLATVHVKRNGKSLWFFRFVYLTGIHLLQFVLRERKLSCHERLDDAVLHHFCSTVVDVVPHHELTEREESQHGFFNQIPARLLLYIIADGSKHLLHVDSIVIRRQRIQSRYADAKLLTQIFH